MPFWKGKKNNEIKKRVMLCPACLKPGLRYATVTGQTFGQPKLYCPSCGIKTVVYVDINPTDNNEDELEREMLMGNQDFLDSRRPADELAQECLEDKWIEDQSKNENSLRAWCPFCADVEVICSICLCPPVICQSHATGGLIGKLNEKYDDETKLCEVDPQIYSEIVAEFKKLLKEEK
jgi:hypothetical protein